MKIIAILIGIVLSCYDGDTCKVQLDDKTIAKIRLVGIDTPEMMSHKCEQQPYAKEAKIFVNSLIKGKRVEVESSGLDKYGRTLGVIYYKGEDINSLIIQEGLAEVYRGIDYENHEYYNDELEAKNNELGMWKLNEYESPRAYRRRCN